VACTSGWVWLTDVSESVQIAYSAWGLTSVCECVSVRSMRVRMWGCSCLYAFKSNLTSYFAVLFTVLELIACNLKISHLYILYKTIYIYIYIHLFTYIHLYKQVHAQGTEIPNFYLSPPYFSWARIKLRCSVYSQVCAAMKVKNVFINSVQYMTEHTFCGPVPFRSLGYCWGGYFNISAWFVNNFYVWTEKIRNK
jgi:hypothetical protein